MPKDPIYYNVILKTSDGDSMLVAQTTDPHGYVEREYPLAEEATESHYEKLMWITGTEGTVGLIAMPLREITLNVLLPEGQANKIRKEQCG